MDVGYGTFEYHLNMWDMPGNESECEGEGERERTNERGTVRARGRVRVEESVYERDLSWSMRE